jgi:multiple sugar transport system permease protein
MAAVTVSTRVPAATRAQRRVPRLGTAVLAVAAYLIAVIFLLPYLEMVITALRPQRELLDRNYLPSHLAWSNFATLWSTGLGRNIETSLEIAGGATVLVLLVAIPAAYYSARRKFRGRALFLVLVLVTQMFQPTALVVGIYRQFNELNMINSVWSLILVNAGFNLAFAIWILNAYFISIPKDLEEAALVDGTTRFGAMLKVVVPVAWPGIVTALIFTFIAAWNEFIVALTLTTNNTTAPLTVALNGYIGQYQVDWQHLLGGSVVATIPVIILFAFIEGKVVGGLTAGSVK